MDHLFQTGKIKNLTLKNRFVMAPMCMYQSDDTGVTTPWHVVHYATRASGGVGLIILEATAIEARGRISNRDLGIWSDDHIAGLRSIVKEAHAHGSKVGIQLAHAGRKCSIETETLIAPTPQRFSDRYQDPHEMSVSDIKTVIQSFQKAARRAEQAGFDLIEIHGAHGYLINQFISPLTNHRTDEYGGSFDKRLRFLIEVIEAIQMVWPKEKPIVLRLSADEYSEGGHHVNETIKLVNRVKDRIDAFNISSGGVVLTQIDAYSGYQIPLSEQIKKQANVATIGGGLLTSYEMMNAIVRHGQADFIYLGRLLLREPYFPLQVAKHLGLDEWIPTPYKRGF